MTIRQYREQVEAYEQEKATFQRQLTGYSKTQEQLDECQEEVQRVARENSQLKEKLKKHVEGLAQQKVMVNHADMDQPSNTLVVSNPIQACSLPLEQLGKIWSLEAKGPAPQNFFQMYDLQSQLFFLITR